MEFSLSSLRATLLASVLLAALGACSTISPVAAPPSGARAAASVKGTLVRQISARIPVRGAAVEMAALRPMTVTQLAPVPAVVPNANRWKLQATLPGAVIHDIAFPTASVGYAAAELGQVWKTVDGGAKWTEIMNLGFPYYWFGVHALSAKDVVISGFNDSAAQGIIRWSHDGGTTWTQDIILTSSGWSYRTRFADAHNGLVMDGLNYNGPNAAHYTTDGGALAGDWTEVVPDPNGGWFGNEFSLLANLHARASGITYCSSANGGAAWTCGHSVDSVFDGPVFFANDRYGWVGGGEISPNVAGWVHRTGDGGKTWSGRTLSSPFPIRELRFVTADAGWAAGGNIYSSVGGIYFSRDKGKTWTLDVDTKGHEMDACDSHRLTLGYRIWCAGYDSSFSGAVYTLDYKATVPNEP